MAEGVQLKKKVCLRRKEKPAEFMFTEYLKVKLLWQSSTDLDLCIFFTKKDGTPGGVFSSMFRQKKSDMGAQDQFPFMVHTGDEPEPAEGGESVEQINVFKMHGYTAAWILPEGLVPEGLEVKEQSAHRYAAIHIEHPFDNPFVTIPGAYHTLGDFMRTNGLVYVENEVIPCFETEGESMDVFMACK